MVDVSSQSNKVNITVSSSGVSSNVNASGDTSHYYSEKAREWAISNRIVDGVDYSSKYYAGKANESALNAQSFAQSAQDTYNNFQQSVDGALSTVNDTVQGAITTIDTKSDEVIDSINNTKTDIITDIEFIADGEKKDIEDLIDNGKDELKEAIGDVKVLTTLEIGDIGIAPLGIDETKGKRRYLNGQLIIQDQYAQFTNKVKSAVALYPSLACTESEWQTTATMTVGGQVGKFVVDDEAGTIRLPKIIMPIQGLTDLSKLGEIVEAGLPQITHTHTRGTMDITGSIPVGCAANNGDNILTAYGSSSGALYGTSKSVTINRLGNGTYGTSPVLNFQASRNWSGTTSNNSAVDTIYGSSNTVQPESVQYPYFIQVATGAETEDNIINEIELNNPFFLGMSQYFETAPNNISWLKSEGQWNAKAVYTTVYDWALINANNSIEGFKLITDEYTDYDYVLNTSEETFRLPLLNGSEDLPSDKYENLTLEADGSTYTAPANGWFTVSGRPQASNAGVAFVNNNTSLSYTSRVATANSLVSVSVPVKNGEDITCNYDGTFTVTIFRFIYAQGNGSLYFYVGETVQNANLINAGRIEETMLTKYMADGQWVNEPKAICSSVTIASSNVDYDLSDYLPSDGYNYEVIFSGNVTTGTTSGQYINLYINSSIVTTNVPVCGARTRTASSMTSVGSTNIPIGTNRIVTVAGNTTAGGGTYALTAVAYRRLGTNQ